VLLDVETFSMAGRTMRNVRQAVQRTHHFGITTSIVREGDLDTGLQMEVATLSTHWLGGSAERGFSMILDGLGTGVHPECVLVLARDGAGRLVGCQRYVPSGDTLSLDVMRREPGSVNGLNERMIADVVTYAREHGIRLVSLNFAAFRTLLDSSRRGPLERAGYQALHLLDPFIRVESLYRFNAKFHPGYLPRGVAFPSWLSVPVVAAAMVGMEFGLVYDRHRAAGFTPPAESRRIRSR
jgi:lysyl-tRNA synthetase class 2